MVLVRTRQVTPPEPYGCRNPPPPPVSGFEPFDDEVSKRVALHRLLDDAYADFAPPGDRRNYVPPSHRLYTSLTGRPRTAAGWEAELAAWRVRWVAARIQDAQYMWQAPLLDALGLPRLCRGSTDRTQRAVQWILRQLMWEVGNEVHRRLGARYRRENPGHTVSVDGRVYFRGGGSERLSRLALDDPYTVYGGLNYSLAGQRNDIIDLDTGGMWEIKPATLTSANLLQLWGYVDNYEVARIMAFYNAEPALPLMRPGDPAGLDKAILRPFEYSINEEVSLIIVPMVSPLLPGLISYRATVRIRRRPRSRAEARAFLARFNGDIETVVRQSQRRLYVDEQLQLAEGRRLLIAVGIGVLVVAIVLSIVAMQPEAVAPELTAIAELGEAAAAASTVGTAGTVAGAGAAVLEGAEATAAAGRVLQLAEMVDGARGATLVLRGLAAAEGGTAAGTGVAAQQLGALTASMEAMYVAGQAFTVPAEIAGFCIEGACAAAAACIPLIR